MTSVLLFFSIGIIVAGYLPFLPPFVFLAARNNLSAQFGVRRKHAMETNEVEPWPGNQRSQPLHEFQWRHDDVGRAIPIRCLQL